jgi:UDP-N-acetylglucosamine 2-epimerase (non-hydrolysing)
MRENTERPVTISQGTNFLVAKDKHKIISCIQKILDNRIKEGSVPKYWDGKAASRIIQALAQNL